MPGHRVEQWKEAGRQEEREKHRAEVRDLALAISEAAAGTRAEERSRIRRELDEVIGEIGVNRTGYPGGEPSTWVLADELLAVLDRICPDPDTPKPG